MAWTEKKKASLPTREKSSREMPLSSHDIVTVQCDKCPHTFEARINTVVSKNGPTWCPYCAGQKLCEDQCDFCGPRSLAGWNNAHKLSCFVVTEKLPRDILIDSVEKCIFQCDRCLVQFEAALNTVTRTEEPIWCLYCP